MIIYGWRHFAWTDKQGEFHCPNCDIRRPFRQKSTRLWFTLYFFLPVIPLGGKTEYVECAACGGTFQPTVLTYDPSQEQAAAAVEYRLALVLLLRDCGRTSTEDLTRLSAMFGALFGQQATVETLQQDLAHAQQAGEAAGGFAARLAQNPTEGKLLVMTTAVQVLGGGAALRPFERERLEKFGADIRLDPAAVESVLKQAGGTA